MIYGLVLIYPAYILPETISHIDKNAIKIRRITRSYREVFQNYALVGYAVVFGFSALLVYVFSAEGPFIGIHTLGFDASDYGMLALLPAIGMLIGCIVSARLAQKVSARLLIYVGALLELFGAVLMLLLFLVIPINIISLLIPMFLVYLGHALVSGNGSSSAMYFAVDKANGSAVMSFLCMLMAVIGTFALATIQSHSSLVMPIIFLVAVVFIFIIQATLKQHVMKKSDS